MYLDYRILLQPSHWHEEIAANSSMGQTNGGNNDANFSANGNNPTDFMWSGIMKTNSSGDTWSGYEPNWDEGLVLNDVDLTGADRAWMSIEMFRHLGISDLYTSDANGIVLAEIWDDAAIIEIFTEDDGWTTRYPARQKHTSMDNVLRKQVTGEVTTTAVENPKQTQDSLKQSTDMVVQSLEHITVGQTLLRKTLVHLNCQVSLATSLISVSDSNLDGMAQSVLMKRYGLEEMVSL